MLAAALRPDGKVRAAALEDICCRARLHIDQHFFFHPQRVGRVIDADSGVGRVKLFEHLLHHRRKPVRAPILMDQLDRLSHRRGGFGEE